MAFNISLVNNSISSLQGFDGDHTIFTPSEAVYTLSEAEVWGYCDIAPLGLL